MKELLLSKDIGDMTGSFEIEGDELIVSFSMRVPAKAWVISESISQITKHHLNPVEVFDKETYKYIKEVAKELVEPIDAHIYEAIECLHEKLKEKDRYEDCKFNLKDFIIQELYVYKEHGKVVDSIICWKQHHDKQLFNNFLNKIRGKYQKTLRLLSLACFTSRGWIEGKDIITGLLDALKNEDTVYTYIASSGTGLYKIGKSKDTMNRLSSLRTANPNIKFEFVIRKNVETELHKKYAIYRYDREWFSLTEVQLKEIKNKYKDFIIK